MSKTDDNKKIQTIVKPIKTEEEKLRQRFSFFQYQNIIGLILLICSLLMMISLAVLYVYQLIPAWFCIIFIAIATSISHEIEHDLIHLQYFRKQPFIYHLMMLVVWLMRPNTVNPWYRKRIHLEHHKLSGTKDDLEERLVGNGIKPHGIRFIVIIDGLLGLIINRKLFNKEIKDFNFLIVFNAGFPLATSYFFLLYSFLLFHLFDYFNQDFLIYPAWLPSVVEWMNFIVVVWVLPNFIRSVSLNFITSSMHYYGGVSSLMQQTQVLNHWLFLPFQLFCFNFGNTHTIHHFVPNQPFYIRQLINTRVKQILKDNGVRFNDLNSILNANFHGL